MPIENNILKKDRMFVVDDMNAEEDIFQENDMIEKDDFLEEDSMDIYRYKLRNSNFPKENHYTASWSNTDKVKPESKVNLPDETQIRNAKEYVDTNQK